MPEFRGYCLTEDDKIVWGSDIRGDDLEDAIAVAHEMCREHLKTETTRVGIWQGAQCLYTSPRACSAMSEVAGD